MCNFKLKEASNCFTYAAIIYYKLKLSLYMFFLGILLYLVNININLLIAISCVYQAFIISHTLSEIFIYMYTLFTLLYTIKCTCTNMVCLPTLFILITIHSHISHTNTSLYIMWKSPLQLIDLLTHKLAQYLVYIPVYLIYFTLFIYMYMHLFHSNYYVDHKLTVENFCSKNTAIYLCMQLLHSTKCKLYILVFLPYRVSRYFINLVPIIDIYIERFHFNYQASCFFVFFNWFTANFI